MKAMATARALGFASVLITGIAITTRDVSAQRLTDTRVSAFGEPASAYPAPAFSAAGDRAVAPRDSTDSKNPVLAGFLSYLMPGTGSYYAGNNSHGSAHLIVHLLVAVPIFSCVSHGTGCALVKSLIPAMMVNDVWSIFTAVGDAKRANRAAAARASNAAGR